MVPNEQWDFTCTQPIVLADLKIGGRTRQVLMQAPKNGFFYVLDRKTGKVISAKSYVPNLWASGVDLKTGRPDRQPGLVSNTTTPHLMTPDAARGAHVASDVVQPDHGARVPLRAGAVDGDVAREGRRVQVRAVTARTAAFVVHRATTEERKKLQAIANSREKGYLLAWNPVKQKEAFRVTYPYPGSGGILSTAGNLLVQGTINKTLAVYRADNGAKLWEMDTQTVAIAGPDHLRASTASNTSR